MTDTASAKASQTSKASRTATHARPAGGGSPDALVRVSFPAPAPAAAAPTASLDGVALITLDRPRVLNALNFDLLDALATALETLDADPSCRAIVITGEGDRGVRGRRRHRGARDPERHVAGGRRPVRGVGPDRGGRAADHRRRSRFRPGRRLRARDGVRHDRRRRGRPVRPARDPDRGHARCRRHPAPDPGDRQGPGDGDDPDRPDAHRTRGRDPWPRHEGRAGRGDRRGRARARGEDRDDATGRRAGGQGGYPRRRRNVA